MRKYLLFFIAIFPFKFD